MGLNIMGSAGSSASATPSTNVAPNPNPFLFEPMEVRQVGRHVVAKIKYHGCPTYEGTKVLVFLDLDGKVIHETDRIDPHFQEHPRATLQGKAPSPVPFARFEPTLLGWRAAISFAAAMNEADDLVRAEKVKRG